MGAKLPLGRRLRTAKQILDGVYTGISPNGAALATEEISAGEYLDKLIDARLFLDALRFIAYALPVRQATWWACLCILDSCPPTDPLDKSSLAAAIDWVIEPTEAARQAVEEASLRGELESPSTLLARAAAFENVRLPQPRYRQPHSFPAKGVFSSLWIASGNTTDHRAAMRRFITLGFDVSQAKLPWPQAAPPGTGASLVEAATRAAVAGA